ncbi:MAG: phosphatidate cytidylyltransferase [Ktedonobacteraceae bacterium]|nr:phosphatidate cytidylyltransferase [Ktedonobacteraceae bacterium]
MQRSVTSDNPHTTNGQRQSVALRWLTASVMIPVVLLVALLGGWWAFAAVLLVVVLGTLELDRMMRQAGHRPLLWISLGLGAVLLVAAMLPAQRLALLEYGLAGAVLAAFFSLLFRKQQDGAVTDWALTLAIPLYIGLPMSFFLLFRGYEPALTWNNGFALSWPRGFLWILTVFLGVWGFDSAAFFSGRYFGRHRLAPRVSPAKTWEGVLGGFVLSITASLLITVGPLGLPWYLAVVLGILIGTAATLGDLAESLIKRQMHVKDSGQLVPGHGGLLDRIDSLLFAVVIVYMFAQLLGK